MYSTCFSGESSGYCDLHRRGLKLGTAFSEDMRRIEACEPLGDRRAKDVAGERRGSPLAFGLLGAERESCVVPIFSIIVINNRMLQTERR